MCQGHGGVAVGGVAQAVAGRRAAVDSGSGDGLGVSAAAEDEAAERVAMSEKHDGLHQLRQGPALLTALQQGLHPTHTHNHSEQSLLSRIVAPLNLV